MGQTGKTPVGIVLPKKYPVFSSRGKHPVGFVDSFGHQVVNQHADIRLVAAKNKRLLLIKLEVRVDSGNYSLGSRFLISRGTVDLACKIQVLHVLEFESRLELGGMSSRVGLSWVGSK